jgi:hypothetical protein
MRKLHWAVLGGCVVALGLLWLVEERRAARRTPPPADPPRLTLQAPPPRPAPPAPPPAPARPLERIGAAAAMPPSDPGRLPIVRYALDQAARPDQAELRQKLREPLGRMRLTRAELEALIPAAAADAAETRAWAVSLLAGRWGAEDAVLLGICRAAARDEDGAVRAEAVRALAGAPEAWAGPVLAELAADPDPRVREALKRE